ncbi:MAG: enoyl-CoA hydratase/isomerase family protein, partial [Phycisphaerales bacterium JB059]
MIRGEMDGDVRVLTLDRPDRRNALTPEMLGELVGAIEASAGARAVCVLGAGEVFCAGFDLRRCAEDGSGESLRSLLTGLSGAIRGLRALEAGVVIGAQGGAIAGGAALLGGG